LIQLKAIKALLAVIFQLAIYQLMIKKLMF